MNLKNRTQSREIEYYQENMEYLKNLKAFQNIDAIFKINSTDFSFLFLFLYVGLLVFES